MRKFLAWITLAILCVSLLVVGGCTKNNTSESFALNTFISQSIYGDKSIIEKNNADFKQIENLMSKTITDSDVYRLNTQQKAIVDDSTLYVLKTALTFREETGGAFNPALGAVVEAWGVNTQNPRVVEAEELKSLKETTNCENIKIDGSYVTTDGAIIDLGGIAKGYALDIAKENMQEAKSGLIIVGGSIYVKGTKPEGAYVVGIKDPLKDGYMATMEIKDTCISTSGIYEIFFEKDDIKYSHIIDPNTLAPIQNELLSVTVINESGIATDAYSTALFIMGLRAGMEFANKNHIDALFITKEKKVYTTDNFSYNLKITEKSYELSGLSSGEGK